MDAILLVTSMRMRCRLRMMQKGRINTSPTGEKIQVMLGTMTDEMATFIIGLGLIVPGASIKPLAEKDVAVRYSLGGGI